MAGLRVISAAWLWCLIGIIPAGVRAQPGALGTELANGFTYVAYPLEDKGIFRQARVQASVDILSFGTKWEFPETTSDYDPVWRPYTCCVALSAFNATTPPIGGTASAVFNTGFGGTGGFLPFVTSGNYYTFNITEYSTPSVFQNEYMAVLETDYNPVEILSLTQSPSPLVSDVENVLISVNLSGPLSTGEYIYLRYSDTYNFTSSNLLELNDSISYHFEYIPCSSDSVYYYVFTSNMDSAAIMAQVALYGQVAYDMLTLELINNGGPNYNYLPVDSPGTCYYTLPVHWLWFEARRDYSKVLLEWATGSEWDNEKFVIERSIDGHVWETAGIVNAVGFSSSESTYQFADFQSPPGIIYYRLKQIDHDGTYAYSEVRYVPAAASQHFYPVLFPNPADQQMEVQLNMESREEIRIHIFHSSGRLMQSTVWKAQPGLLTIPIEVQSWQSGLYFLSLVDESGNYLIETFQVVHSDGR